MIHAISNRQSGSSHQLTDFKPRTRQHRRRLIDHHLLDARAGWSAPDRALEPLERFRLAFRDGLHRAVVVVPDETVEAFAPCRVLCEVSEPDALHPPANQESPG